MNDVHAADLKSDILYAEQRRNRIMEMVRTEGQVTVNDLCDLFQVSATTIRIDLTELERKGLLERTHGGAIPVQNARFELTSSEKSSKNISAKIAIASEAMAFIHEGASIAIDTGTTGMELARQLAASGIPQLTVVTNDFVTAACLEQMESCQVVLLGGMVRPGFHCTTGTAVIRQLSELYIDTFFAATNGIDFTRGLSTPAQEIATIKQSMIAVSKRTILLADHSKFNTNAFCKFADISDVDVIISDQLKPDVLETEPGLQHIRYVQAGGRQ